MGTSNGPPQTLTWPLRLFKATLAGFFKLFFRAEISGLEHYRALGDRAILVVNHQSYLDAALLAALLPDRISFAINKFVAERWWVNPWLSIVHAFRVDPASPYATASIIKMVRKGGRCVIFPEGRITETNGLMKIYDGPALVADKTGAEVLPVRIEGAQFSKVSCLGGKVRRRWFPKLTVRILPARRLSLPEEIKGRRRRQLASAWLYDVMAETRFETADRFPSVFEALLAARHLHGGSAKVLEDTDWQPADYDRIRLGAMVLGRKLAALTEPRETVGFLLPNAVGTVITFFGLTAFARVPAMLNFTAGAGPVSSACRTAAVKTVITSRRFVERAKLGELVARLAQTVRIVYLEEVRAGIGRWDKLRGLIDARRALSIHRRFGVQAAEPAVILFTSGSEGEPKGVVLSHDNILANCRQAMARIDFTARDTVLNVLPMFHSFGMTAGTVLPLVNGVKVFMYPSPLHYRIIPEIAYSTKATILFGTDTFLSGYGRSAHPYDFFALRYVFAGAEALREETRLLWANKFGVRVFEGYGVTETSPVVALNTPLQSRPGTVGRLIPGMAAKLEPIEGIPEGGRLYLSGPNIMLGYLRPERPGVIEPPVDGWHDTGDIGALDPGGYLRIIGRVKRFAKIGGEMISLAVPERMAAQLWPDHQHAVVVVPDGRKGEQLALITTNPTADRLALAEHARQEGTSELAVPRHVLTTEELPVLGTGKLDYVRIKTLASERLARRRAA